MNPVSGTRLSAIGFSTSRRMVFFASRTLEREPPSARVPHSAGGLFADPADVVGFHPDLQSGVVLAGVNRKQRTARGQLQIPDDGILTAMEVAAMELRETDLVVLSACETGLGEQTAGEGLLGLQRAFHLAGVPTVVASLWKVDDAATQVLMSEFYRNLWERKLGSLEALRAAQLALIAKYDVRSGEIRGLGKSSVPLVTSEKKPTKLPPYYWAAFQLSGDTR
jgi:CHAT domain-containing protein